MSKESVKFNGNYKVLPEQTIRLKRWTNHKIKHKKKCNHFNVL